MGRTTITMTMNITREMSPLDREMGMPPPPLGVEGAQLLREAITDGRAVDVTFRGAIAVTMEPDLKTGSTELTFRCLAVEVRPEKES